MEDHQNKVQQFVSLLTTYQGKIQSYILSMVPNFQDASDIMQDTSKMMWDKFDDFKEGSNFLAWGITIARYRVLEFRNKKRRRKEIQFDNTVLESLQEDQEKRQDKTNEFLTYIKSCYQKLPEQDKRIILMRYHEGQKIKDMAGVLGKTVQTVYRNISRVQGSLLICLKQAISFEEKGV